MQEKKSSSVLDSPEITDFLFYPRRESGLRLPDYASQFDVMTADNVRIGCRFYLSTPENPHILFFHGNGEIAEDYDEIGQLFTKLKMNFMVADYRGYGRSEGQPGLTAMLQDSHDIFKSIVAWRENRKGSLWVMGRSLGSACAIELAASYPEMVDGLVIESGFAQTIPLLVRLGINIDKLDIKADQIFSNADKIQKFSKPTLIIHAQYDQIIPLNHGEELFRQSPASIKELHIIPEADHNSILMIAGMSYFDIICDFIHKADKSAVRSIKPNN